MQPTEQPDYFSPAKAEGRAYRACASDAAAEAILIHQDSRYAAYGRDLEYMWHWEISCDGEFVQEGCSLSEESSREAVAHVINFFHRQDLAKATPGDKTEEIRKLLLEIGLPQPTKP